METTSPRKRMIAAGRIPPLRPSPCASGHVGPFAFDAAHTAWMRRLCADLGMPVTKESYGCCLQCGSHVQIPAAEVA